MQNDIVECTRNLSFMSVLSISGCAHVISIHTFHYELSCLCLSDISTTSSGMPVHNTEASDASSFRSFLTGYGPSTYLTCWFENEMANSKRREVNHIAKLKRHKFLPVEIRHVAVTWTTQSRWHCKRRWALSCWGTYMFKHIFQQMSEFFQISSNTEWRKHVEYW